MLEVDNFAVIAEVSITFTGLAGIVSVLGQSRLSTDARAWRVRNMIVLSLLSFFLSLLPMALHYSPLEPAVAWSVCSLALIGGQAIHLGLANRLTDEKDISGITVGWLMLVYLTGSLTTVVLQVGNLIWWTQPGPFFTGICWFMFLASLHFFVLVVNTHTGSEKKQ